MISGGASRPPHRTQKLAKLQRSTTIPIKKMEEFVHAATGWFAYTLIGLQQHVRPRQQQRTHVA